MAVTYKNNYNILLCERNNSHLFACHYNIIMIVNKSTKKLTAALYSKHTVTKLHRSLPHTFSLLIKMKF